jgi:hypothetical protein
MSLTLPPDAEADSFCSVVFADGYLSDADWNLLEFSAKEEKLKLATETLNNMPWKGLPTEETNALVFPMRGLYDPYGRAIDESTVPVFMQRSTARLAQYFIANSPVIEKGQQVAQVSAGSVGITFREPVKTQSIIPDFILNVIRPYLMYQGVKLVRD